MDSNLEKAEKILIEGSYTSVLCKGDLIYTSKEKGIKPLIEWVDTGMDFSGFSAADQIVGKSAALIYVLLGVKEVYGIIMSENGYKTLERHNIKPFCQTKVKEIRNRSNTDLCPMEKTVVEIDDPQEGFMALVEKVNHMTGQKR